MSSDARPIRFGVYQVEAELGRGAMGIVYRARRPDGELVAIKVLGASSAGREPRERRFARERDLLAGLDHPNLVRFVDAGDGPPPYLVMEFVRGDSLAARLARGPLSPAEAARTVADIALGIAHAHERGILHRDLKPANVIVRADDGRAVVTDFGLGKDLDASAFTQEGTPLGTLLYMAPEQLRGEAGVGPPVDVWALGVLLYECLAGVGPFFLEDTSTFAVTSRIEAGKIEPLARRVPGVAPELEALVTACLAVDPARRPQAIEVVRRLRAYRPRETPVSPGRRALLGVAVFALGLAVVATVVVRRRSGSATPAPTPTPQVDLLADLPAPPPGWKTTWILGAGPAPELRPRALFEGPRPGESPGSIVACPARFRTEPDALAAAFLGTARRAPAGRVAVAVDLARAARIRTSNPELFFARAEPGAYSLDPAPEPGEPSAFSLLVPNDAGTLRLGLGAASWEGARVSLRVRGTAIDATQLTVHAGAEGEPRLLLSGRGAFAGVDGVRVPFAFAPGLQSVSFAPGAAAGSRVTVEGAGTAPLDAKSDRPAPAGGVYLELAEGRFELAAVEVEGVPRSPDVPARALAPGSLVANARIAARFQTEGAGEGGPILELGPADGEGLRLELAPRQLALRLAGRLLAAAPLPEGVWADGLLVLERASDIVRAEARLGAAVVRLPDVAAPLPLAADPLRASFGTTGRRTVFARVAVASGPPDLARQQLDRAASTGDEAALEAAGGSAPRERARRGALLLARVGDLERADPSLFGDRALRTRHAAARRAAEVLLDAATGLEKDPSLAAAPGDARVLRRDALARATRAFVLAGDPEAAGDAARRLVSLDGLDEARRAFLALDDTGTDDGKDHLTRLAIGYGISPLDASVALGAVTAAEVLVPERRADLLLQKGQVFRDGVARDDTSEPARARLLQALDLFEEARRAGCDGIAVDEQAAPLLERFGRYEEALAAWRRAIARGPALWFTRFRAAQCLGELGRAAEGLEAALGALALAPESSVAQQGVAALVRKAASVPAHRGLAAVGILALADLGPPEGRGDALRRALALLGDDAALDERSRDLAAYVRVRAGQSGGPLGDRPLLALARARLSRADASRLLRDAAATEPLVAAVARLDPDLATWLGR